MSGTRMLPSLAAWVVFTLICRLAGSGAVGYASGAALLVALVVVMVRRRDGLSILDITAATTFAVMTVAAVASGASGRELLDEYGRGACAAVLAVVMAVSALTVPFTEHYAKAATPRDLWSSPHFRAVNRSVSAIWAGVVAAIALGHLADGRLAAGSPQGRSPVGDLALNWGVPVVLIGVGMVLTRRTVARARLRTHVPPQEAGAR